MPKTRLEKEETVVKLKEKLQKSKALVFTDFKGLTMAQLSDLRNKLRDQNAEFTITKNTLLKLAKPEIDLDGPTATLFAYDDEISPLKTLVKSLKDFTIGKIKGGYLGSEVLSEAKIIQLSTLPSKQELRGKVVGVLAAPLTGMVSVLQGNLRNLVYALSEVQKMRGGELQG